MQDCTYITTYIYLYICPHAGLFFSRWRTLNVAFHRSRTAAVGLAIYLFGWPLPHILLMEEILHHLGCIEPSKKWKIYNINRCRISSINSRTNKTEKLCACFFVAQTKMRTSAQLSDYDLSISIQRVNIRVRGFHLVFSEHTPSNINECPLKREHFERN